MESSFESEDPTTPKTIHMTRHNTNNHDSSNPNNNIHSNNIQNAPSSLSLPFNSDNSDINNNNNNNNNSNRTPSLVQRSIPVHKRNHFYNSNTSNYGYSITSSTRSVKSIGSSIIDTEDDKSQAGISFMSQDYNDEKSVLSRDVPRIVPRSNSGAGSIGLGSSVGDIVIGEDDDDDNHDNDNDDDDDDNDLEIGDDDDDDNDFILNRHNGGNNVLRILEKYTQAMTLSMEKGLREIKEQNKRDHAKVMATLQNEANRRSALEGRLHAQILLQSETLVAMEVKLLKLEAKVEKRDAALRRRNVNFGDNRGNTNSTGASNTNLSGSMTAPTTGGQISLHTSSRSGGLENGTIDEEDVFDMREIRVNTNESHSRNLRGSLNTSVGSRIGSGTNIAVISSGASLASAVTATSFLDGLEPHDDTHTHGGDDGESERSGDGDVEDEDEGDIIEEHDGSASTPTQGSRSHFTNIESILLNPIVNSVSTDQGLSTRAVRGDYDGNSSLATSMTNTTVASTIVTATTGGVELANSTSVSQRGEDIETMLALSPPTQSDDRQSRSRSQSPLTVHSAATASVGPQSTASFGTVGTSIISTAAVAPARSFRARREAAARMGNPMNVDSGRQITNRFVTFTSNEVLELPPDISEGGDSITMPDEFDNLSDVADALADRGRLWREEYEARLDAIHKRFNGEQ